MENNTWNYTSEKLNSLLNSLSQWLSEHGLAIVLIITVAWVSKEIGTRFLSKLLNKTIRDDLYPTEQDRQRRIETIKSITSAILKVGVAIVAIIMILSELGINTAPLLASAGIIGIALGFGAQSLIKDFTSGLFIIIDNQYRVGDYVQLSYGSSTVAGGTVEAITIRTTALRALNGTLHHVSNGSITATANMTMGVGGMYEEIIVDHDTDIATVSMIIDTVGKNMKANPEFADKLIEPPRFVRVDGIHLDGIRIKVLSVTGANDSWTVRGEFYKRLLKEFRKAKIVMPTSQQLTIQQMQDTPPKSKSKKS